METDKERDRRVYLEIEAKLARRTPEQVKRDQERMIALLRKHGFQKPSDLLK